MNALIENFPRWLAVITVGALGVAVAHEYGYFWVIGAHFQTIATTYDYLVNALLWLPSTIFIVGVVYTFEGFMIEPESYSWPTFPAPLMIGVGSPLFVIGSMTVFFGGTFVYEIAYLLSVAAVYCGLAAYAFKYSHVPWETFRPLLFIPPLLLFSFAWGSLSAETDLRKTGDVFFLQRKSDNSPRAVVMLRGFEKGLLIRDHNLDRTELVRWDDVVSFWRFSTSKKEPSISCQWIGIYCDFEVKPLP